MLEGFCPHRETDNRWGKKLYAVIDYRSSPRSSTDIDNAFLGNLETGTLLWWIFCQKAGTCADDCKLHQLSHIREGIFSLPVFTEAAKDSFSLSFLWAYFATDLSLVETAGLEPVTFCMWTALWNFFWRFPIVFNCFRSNPIIFWTWFTAQNPSVPQTPVVQAVVWNPLRQIGPRFHGGILDPAKCGEIKQHRGKSIHIRSLKPSKFRPVDKVAHRGKAW